MQQILIENLALSGEGPFDMIARPFEAPITHEDVFRWLHEPALGLPNENEFRCLVSFMVGGALTS